jgi:hypothetical protein
LWAFGNAFGQSLGENGYSVDPFRMTIDSDGICLEEVMDFGRLQSLCSDNDGCRFRLTFFHDNGTLYYTHGMIVIAADGVAWKSTFEFEAGLGGNPASGEIGDNDYTVMAYTQVGGCGLTEDNFQQNGDVLLESCSTGACTLRIDD